MVYPKVSAPGMIEEVVAIIQVLLDMKQKNGISTMKRAPSQKTLNKIYVEALMQMQHITLVKWFIKNGFLIQDSL